MKCDCITSRAFPHRKEKCFVRNMLSSAISTSSNEKCKNESIQSSIDPIASCIANEIVDETIENVTNMEISDALIVSIPIDTASSSSLMTESMREGFILVEEVKGSEEKENMHVDKEENDDDDEDLDEYLEEEKNKDNEAMDFDEVVFTMETLKDKAIKNKNRMNNLCQKM